MHNEFGFHSIGKGSPRWKRVRKESIPLPKVALRSGAHKGHCCPFEIFAGGEGGGSDLGSQVIWHHTHIHTRTCAHAHMRVPAHTPCTHTYTETYTRVHTHHSHICTHVHVHGHMCIRAPHTRVYPRAHLFTHTYTRTYTPHRHTYIFIHRHTRSPRWKQTRTHKRPGKFTDVLPVAGN